MKATTDKPGVRGRGAIDAEEGGDGWRVMGKNGRVTACGGGGVEEQADTNFSVDEVWTC